MSRTILMLFIVLRVFQISFLCADDTKSQTQGWSLELSGGLQFFTNNDLCLATEAENSYLDLYYRNNPYYQTLDNPGFATFSYQFSGQARIKYRLGRHFSIGASLNYLSGNSSNNGLFSFQWNQNWRILTDSLDYQALDTKLNMVFPNLGLFYRLPLGAKTDMELGLCAGPVFAEARLKRHIIDSIQVREVSPVNEYIMYRDERALTMEGSGTGLGVGANLKLEFKIGQSMGLFFETGYTFYHLPSLSGRSTDSAGGQTRSWEGEWFMVGEQVAKNWGTADFFYPSNDPSLQLRRVGEFELNIHAFLALQLGIYLNL